MRSSRSLYPGLSGGVVLAVLLALAAGLGAGPALAPAAGAPPPTGTGSLDPGGPAPAVATAPTPAPLPQPALPARLVSLAPSLTETLFALGLGGRVVGVTDYCTFPAEAQARPKVGGFIDPNLEAIVALSPDLVVLLPDHRETQTRLESLGIPCLAVPQYTVADIEASLTLLGGACDAASTAAAVRGSITASLELTRRMVDGLPHPRVALAVGHEVTGGRLDQACLAGPKSYLDELLRQAGAENAVGELGLTYPTLSREGLAQLDPDVVIDLIPEPERQAGRAEAVREAWSSVPGLRAAGARRIFVLDSNAVAIPGPRVGEVVASLARLLHPEAAW